MIDHRLGELRRQVGLGGEKAVRAQRERGQTVHRSTDMDLDAITDCVDHPHQVRHVAVRDVDADDVVVAIDEAHHRVDRQPVPHRLVRRQHGLHRQRVEDVAEVGLELVGARHATMPRVERVHLHRVEACVSDHLRELHHVARASWLDPHRAHRYVAAQFLGRYLQHRLGFVARERVALTAAATSHVHPDARVAHTAQMAPVCIEVEPVVFVERGE